MLEGGSAQSEASGAMPAGGISWRSGPEPMSLTCAWVISYATSRFGGLATLEGKQLAAASRTSDNRTQLGQVPSTVTLMAERRTSS